MRWPAGDGNDDGVDSTGELRVVVCPAVAGGVAASAVDVVVGGGVIVALGDGAVQAVTSRAVSRRAPQRRVTCAAYSPPVKEPGSATIEDFDRLDIRVGRILEAAPLEGARRPAYRFTIDFGPGGMRQSSAQLVATYPDPAVLVGRLVVAVVNFPARRVAGFRSEVLVLGALPDEGRIPLLSVDEGAQPGDRIG
jgi:tRNA-binding protein